jgi:hypothetical protein
MIEQLQKALLTDQEYRESWKANIAMAFKDEYFARYASAYAPKEEPHSAELVHSLANAAAERFINALCANVPPTESEKPLITPTEAVYGFAAWLTSSRKRIVMSSRHNATPALEAVVEFCNTNNLPPLDFGWEQKVQFPNLMKVMQDKRLEMGQRLFTKQGELPIEDEEEDKPVVSGCTSEMNLQGLVNNGSSCVSPSLNGELIQLDDNTIPPAPDPVPPPAADSSLASLEGAANFTLPANGLPKLDDMPF